MKLGRAGGLPANNEYKGQTQLDRRRGGTPLSYPLLLEPVFKERPWGGRRLENYYADLPPGPIGEAWVLSGHPNGETRIANGPHKGKALSELYPDFPLLIKLLDANQDLSVQVHPGDTEQERGKTEMWLVLAAEPGAKLVYGVKPGTSKEQLEAALQDDPTHLLNYVEAKPGDVFFVPAGMIHALGGGLLVAEIQQSSDTTYRLYDYGRPRELHLAQGLAVADLGVVGEQGRPRPPQENEWVTQVTCPYFTVQRGRLAGRWSQQAADLQALLVLAGEGSLVAADVTLPLRPGAALLVPAGVAYELQGEADLIMTRGFL